MYDAIRSGSKIIGEEKNDITADVARQAVLNLYKGGQILTTPQVVDAQLREWNLEPPRRPSWTAPTPQARTSEVHLEVHLEGDDNRGHTRRLP